MRLWPGEWGECGSWTIIPRSWGGETTFDSLEPLCAKHNNGKRNFFVSLSPYSEAIKKAIGRADPWMRIGGIAQGIRGAGQIHTGRADHGRGAGNQQGRPVQLRYVLGCDIVPHRRRENGITTVEYELRTRKPWPHEGARAVVSEYERRRRGKRFDPEDAPGA